MFHLILPTKVSSPDIGTNLQEVYHVFSFTTKTLPQVQVLHIIAVLSFIEVILALL
jgi:hypothetical protein